jgi:glycerol-3-phosphate dehydrogenase
MMNRAKNLKCLAEEEFDLCIIGGGASGAGAALDAALRGLKVALIEQTDFAAETSSRSTKLVHGGVRYLEQAFKNLDFAQLRQVRHGLEERQIVLKNAPHLTQPLGLITPVFSWWEGLYFAVGLTLYDWFAGKNKIFPASRWLSKSETLQRIPGLNPTIHSSVLYYDGQLDDARYCLALVQSAAALKAVVANHLELFDFKKAPNGKILAALVKDGSDSGEIIEVKARQFLNCTGPHADHIRQLANKKLEQCISPSKGVHLVLPANLLKSEQALLIPKTKDGRMVFAIPFEGTLILGTTDEPYEHLEAEPLLLAKEADFLLETLQPFLTQKVDKTAVKAGFGGIRPLIKAGKQSSGKQTKSLLRDHEVERDEHSGLISLLGGKWTTYRIMARDAINEVMKGFKQIPAQVSLSKTKDHALIGTAGFDTELWNKLHEKFGLEHDVCKHLAAKYGGLANKVVSITTENPAFRERILDKYPFIKAEIIYAVREEMALELRDFLARRIRLEIMDWEATKEAVPTVAQWMGQELGWTEGDLESKMSTYLALINHFIEQSRNT